MTVRQQAGKNLPRGVGNGKAGGQQPYLRRAYAESVGAAMGCESVVLLSPGTPGDAPFLAAEPGALTPDCVWDLAFD